MKKDFKNKIIADFNNMDNMPIFEINGFDNEEEFYLYNIKVNEMGFFTNGYSDGVLHVDFDPYFESLDYYLEWLYDLCINDIISYENARG